MLDIQSSTLLFVIILLIVTIILKNQNKHHYESYSNKPNLKSKEFWIGIGIGCGLVILYALFG